MAQVTFIGDPRRKGQGPIAVDRYPVPDTALNDRGNPTKWTTENREVDTISMFGLDFRKFHPVEVPDDHPQLGKLRANGHFVVEDDEPAEKGEPEQAGGKRGPGRPRRDAA